MRDLVGGQTHKAHGWRGGSVSAAVAMPRPWQSRARLSHSGAEMPVQGRRASTPCVWLCETTAAASAAALPCRAMRARTRKQRRALPSDSVPVMAPWLRLKGWIGRNGEQRAERQELGLVQGQGSGDAGLCRCSDGGFGHGHGHGHGGRGRYRAVLVRAGGVRHGGRSATRRKATTTQGQSRLRRPGQAGNKAV